MYKVFVNDSPIILTTSQKNENNFPTLVLEDCSFEDLFYELQENRLNGVNLYTPDLEIGWAVFNCFFVKISAAGGLVLNNAEEVLFIFRNGKWDLPKGKIEVNETIEMAAIREVEEECGIQNIKLIKPLITTYHLYFYKQIILKETFWFLMSSDDNNTLTPQLEEGITKVSFKNNEQASIALQNSYKNILLVYDTYLKM